jgi:hypothetical protein
MVKIDFNEQLFYVYSYLYRLNYDLAYRVYYHFIHKLKEDFVQNLLIYNLV